MRKRLLMVLLLLTAAVSPIAGPEPAAADHPGYSQHWPWSSSSDRWLKFVDTTCDPNWKPVIEGAVNFWNAQLDQIAIYPNRTKLAYQQGYTCTGVNDPNCKQWDGDWIWFCFKTNPNNINNPGGFGGVLADNQSGGHAIAGFAWMYVGQSVWPYTTVGIHQVVRHELGHALGLGHNGSPTDIMCNGFYACNFNNYPYNTGLLQMREHSVDAWRTGNCHPFGQSYYCNSDY